MAKLDKAYQQRQEGMIFALKIAKEKGIDKLEQEIRNRGILKLDIWADSADMEKMYRTFNCLQNNMTVTSILMALKREEGFGTVRLHRVYADHLKNMESTGDLNYLGKHHVKFSDYARVLNEEHKFDFDLALIEAAEVIHDDKDPRINKPDVPGLVEELRRVGFNDAADWIEERFN